MPQIAFHRLHDMTVDALLKLGCRVWNVDPNGTLMLFPVSWIDHIPADLKVESISGDIARWSDKPRGRDGRFGMLAYGVRVK